jgi:outer membrane protein
VKLKRRIAIAINAAYTKLVTSSATIVSQKENVETAREGLRIARESYRAGVIRNAELLTAELSLSNARTSYINAVHGYYVSLASLKKEIGGEDERIILEENAQ